MSKSFITSLIPQKLDETCLRVRVTIYDTFGLDSDDIGHGRLDGLEGAVAGNGFAAWYVLQHYRGTNNRHNPFSSFFTREFTFRISLN